MQLSVPTFCEETAPRSVVSTQFGRIELHNAKRRGLATFAQSVVSLKSFSNCCMRYMTRPKGLAIQLYKKPYEDVTSMIINWRQDLSSFADK